MWIICPTAARGCTTDRRTETNHVNELRCQLLMIQFFIKSKKGARIIGWGRLSKTAIDARQEVGPSCRWLHANHFHPREDNSEKSRQLLSVREPSWIATNGGECTAIPCVTRITLVEGRVDQVRRIAALTGHLYVICLGRDFS